MVSALTFRILLSSSTAVVLWNEDPIECMRRSIVMKHMPRKLQTALAVSLHHMASAAAHHGAAGLCARHKSANSKQKKMTMMKRYDMT